MVYLRLSICLSVAVLIQLHLFPALAQTPPLQKPPTVDAQMRLRLMENIIRELKNKYVVPEKTKAIESELRKKFRSGAYDKIASPRELASALTNDLRSAGKDLHLYVTYDPELERTVLALPHTPSFELQEPPPNAARLAELRQSNYNFRKLEILRGNVGYLELRSFVDLNYSKETAVAAMNFLGNSDAVIIDLRKNPGGFINLEIFLASYFYGVDAVEWLSRYHREGDVTVRDWTLREVPGKRLSRTDLYILTSRETGSAAEGFSFILQQRKRAKIVGEKTSGAGYGNRETPIGDGFVFFISVFRQFDPRTGRGWENDGVVPDLSVPAEQALRAAHAEAIKNLALNSTEESRKQQLGWLAPLLEFEAYGPKQVPASLLQSYAGRYDGGSIVITIEQGQPYFLGASGVKRKLHALADDYFLIEDASVPPESQARVRFVRNPDGVVTELRLMISGGRAFPRIKDRE